MYFSIAISNGYYRKTMPLHYISNEIASFAVNALIKLRLISDLAQVANEYYGDGLDSS